MGPFLAHDNPHRGRDGAVSQFRKSCVPPPESARIQHLAPQPPRQLGQGQPRCLHVVRGSVRPGVPGPQHDGQRLPVPLLAVVGPGGRRVMTFSSIATCADKGQLLQACGQRIADPGR